MLSVLMPSGALSPVKVDRARCDAGGVSPEILERCFLPYPANTIAPADNAKVSLLVENLANIVLRDGGGEIFSSPGFREAVEKGVRAREEKAKRKVVGGRGGRGRAAGADGEDEVEARLVLEMSGERLRVLADVVDGIDGDDDDEGEGMDVQEGQ